MFPWWAVSSCVATTVSCTATIVSCVETTPTTAGSQKCCVRTLVSGGNLTDVCREKSRPLQLRGKNSRPRGEAWQVAVPLRHRHGQSGNECHMGSDQSSETTCRLSSCTRTVPPLQLQSAVEMMTGSVISALEARPTHVQTGTCAHTDSLPFVCVWRRARSYSEPDL